MNKILIVGLGLIGGSYAKGLTKGNYQVFGIDINLETVKQAYLDGSIINQDVDIVNILKKIDILILCLYPKDNIEWLKKYQRYLLPKTLITDVTGVKVMMINEVQSFLRSDLIFIPSHPMAGKEVSGYQHSNEHLFEGANFIITPAISTERIDELYKLAKVLKFSRIEILTPNLHDEIIGYLSQLTHIIAVALMNTHETTNLIRYTGDSFRDLTRIAKINDNLWNELFFSNKEVLIKEINDFQKALKKIENKLIQNDKEGLKQILIESSIKRQAFDEK